MQRMMLDTRAQNPEPRAQGGGGGYGQVGVAARQVPLVPDGVEQVEPAARRLAQPVNPVLYVSVSRTWVGWHLAAAAGGA
jgi:hypothetical protein